MDHINPTTHAGPKANGYLIQKQDGRWHIYDANGDHTLHDRATMGEAIAVAKMNQPSPCWLMTKHSAPREFQGQRTRND